MTTAGLSIGAPPEGLPDPNIAPPQLARSGDPFARVRVVHFLSRLPRNTTLQLRDVVASLNAAFLDWSFSEKVVLAELVQLQANWAISFHGDDRIVLDRNERGHTLLIVDSTRMTPFLVAEANRAGQACEEELRRFTLGDGITTTFKWILISTYDGDLDTLKGLIEAAEADQFVRAGAVDKTAQRCLHNRRRANGRARQHIVE